MLILKEATWEICWTLEKSQEKCKFESGIESFVESGFVSFNRVGEKKTNMLKKLRKNKQKKDKTTHTKKETPDYRLKSAFLLTFFISFPMFSRFPKFFLQNQHFAAKFPLVLVVRFISIVFRVFCWVSVFQLFLCCLVFVFFCFVFYFQMFFVVMWNTD